ncbi:MAG: UDP-glucose 4-epimerase [Candidatus Giovannonibacteria bacterium GW2011_GWA2_53_7]|uniref:UDP-glucose 4-epimerase n=1 Tax=Candidatus Giovannonibacteria bacterium GW2011_GWA2_53_7 TaxID=1618650 RepID=A0A0G1Y181_9BACT|nr:MAG: UDP-glucose 4-epimerase [Candidatus Giovannonibacteria bacterium GW2011_GWA2_53_7]
MVAVVTGGAGFIGSHIVDELVKRRIKVHVIDDLSNGYKENLNPNVTFHQMSITSPKLRALFERVKPDYVFHLAAQISVRRSIQKPMTDAKTNILGAINLLEACRRAGSVKKIIAASSGGVMYSSALKKAHEEHPIYPESPYGIAKRSLELYLEHYFAVFGIPYVALRFSNVYGPRQRMMGTGEGGVVAVFAQMLLQEQAPFLTWRGKQTRDYVYVDDVVRSALLAMKSPFVGIVNISTCEEISVHRIFDLLAKFTGFKGKPNYKPEVPGEKKRTCMENRLARKELGWIPRVGIEEGLRKTVEFHRRELKRKEHGL